MSDFDKEAERERLREKYERDKQKREATEHMSELLLQGATMTNAHCSECNDPIFRYDGQEFCATCEKPVDRDTGEDSDGEADGEPAENIEVTSPSDDAHVQFGGSDEQSSEADDERQRTAKEPSHSQRPDEREGQKRPSSAATQRDTAPQREDPQQQPSRSTPPQPHRQSTPAEKQSTTAPQANDVTAVRESLIRTMTRFSQQAETCEDPQRAREYLAAAREAAETLETLRR